MKTNKSYHLFTRWTNDICSKIRYLNNGFHDIQVMRHFKNPTIQYMFYYVWHFCNYAAKFGDSLLIAVVSEAYERELVAHKGLWYWKGLLLSPIFLNVIKVTGVNITAQFRYYWGSRCIWRIKMYDDAGKTEPVHYIYKKC